MVVLKLILIIVLIFISIQDIKDRQVYWFLFPIAAIIASILFYPNTLPELFIASVIINLLFVLVLFGVIYTYAKLKLKADFRSVFGLGDALLFLAFAFSFSSVSFIVVFIFALIFSLLIHVALKKRQKITSVPLAGYMSLFFGITYVSFWIGITSNLYTI